MTKSELMNIAEHIAIAKTARTNKLYYCQAEIISQFGEMYTALKSYNTVVAVYSGEHNAIYVFEYYSATTCQHVAKFRKYMQEELGQRATIVKLYGYSQMGKKELVKHMQCDWQDLIDSIIR